MKALRISLWKVVPGKWLGLAPFVWLPLVLLGQRVGAELPLSKPSLATDSVPLSPASADRSRFLPGQESSSIPRTTAALAIVVVGIVVAMRLARRFVPGLNSQGSQRTVQILSQTPLGARGIVYVLRCGPRVLIVGATGNQLTVLAEIADPDEIAEFIRLNRTEAPGKRGPGTESSNPAPDNQELRGQLDGMLNQIDRWKTTS